MILILSIKEPAIAQSDSTYFDTKGNDFWLTFPPNYHRGKQDQWEYYDDSLYIFITADKPTNGVIEYMDLGGRIFTRNFSIPDPTKIYTFSLFYDGVELLGYNDNSGDLINRHNSEVVTKQYFHITSDNEVTVYAHNQANTTSDACLVLPTDILGKDYFVMSYKSDGYWDALIGVTEASTPSQFVILGTEDGTSVTIIPKNNTEYNNRNTQNIILNKGEAYLVQAKIARTELNNDMTGSEVHSSKPVAVFAGHQRSRLPILNIFGGQPSRDYLLEQMPPIETWGQNALLIPYEQPAIITQNGNDLFRILAANDNTDLYINNILVDRLNKGEFYEGDLTTPAHVKASAPILVAQFKKTSGYGSIGINNDGDPFEMLIPPVEQFMTNYRVINTQAYQYSISRRVYDLQYIIIVATDSSFASVKLDGNPIQLSYFKPIPNSNYFYANVRVSDGVHTISCNAKVGVYVYGYGEANSYGYVGGMSMTPIDFSPPQIASSDSCFSVRGMISDSLVSDSRIVSVLSPVETQVNVNVNIQNFSRYSKFVNFNAWLQNFYDDGEFEIIATDSMGLFTNKKYEIPGFTLSVKDNINAMFLPEHSRLYRIGREYCYPVVIQNYGKHQQRINQLILKNNSNFRIIYNTPKVLSPGEIDSALICFSSPVDTSFIDTLSIVGDCGIRGIQAFNLTFKGDTNKPAVQKILDPCNKVADITVSDSTIVDFGLVRVDVIDTINCSLTIEKFFPKYEKLKFSVIDPYKDAIYYIQATDSAGFVTDIRDTIQGFTIEFPDVSSLGNSFGFDSTKIGMLACDYVKIKNTGLLPITFDHNLFLNQNIIFSVPVSQLPLTVKPGESTMLKVCFSPLYSNPEDQYDTLTFEFNCLYMKINLLGLALPLLNDASSKCNVPVRLIQEEIPGAVFLGQSYPNPSTNFATIRFGIVEDGFTSMKIYDLYGNISQTVINKNLENGIYEIQINTNELNQGVYIYTLSSGENFLTRTMIIRK